MKNVLSSILSRRVVVPLVLLVVPLDVVLLGQSSVITSLFPRPWSVDAADSAQIAIQYALPLDVSNVNTSTVMVTGSIHGRYEGMNMLVPEGTVIGFAPYSRFIPGEVVQVTVRDTLRTMSGTVIPPHGWQFTVSPRKGSGQFVLTQSSTTVVFAGDMQVADLDSDGDADIVGRESATGTVVVSRNNGNLTFTTLRYQLQQGFVGWMTAPVDIDRDGRNDIVVMTNTNTVVILRQEADGTFAPGVPIPFSGVGDGITAGDIDFDGYPDVVLRIKSPWTGMRIWRNKGGSSLEEVDTLVQELQYTQVGLADLDGDGDLDIVYGSALYERTEGFTFHYRGKTAFMNPSRVMFCDFDADGDADMALAASGYVTLLRNDGGFLFNEPAESQVYGPAGRYWSFGDFDDDGDLDFVITSGDRTYAVCRNEGEFTFTRTASTNPESISYFESVAADFDGDGDVDLAFRATGPTLYLAFNKEIEAALRTLNSPVEFQVVQLDSSKVRELLIVNDGVRDTLVVDSIRTSHSAFTVNPVAAVVAPGDTLHLHVQFLPTEPRVYADSMTIYSNDARQPAVTVLLSGEVDQLVSITPRPYSSDFTDSTTIAAVFALALDPASVTMSTVKLTGTSSGRTIEADVAYDGPTRTARITPLQRLSRSELIRVSFTSGVRTPPGSPIFNPRQWDYRVRSVVSTGLFRARDSLVLQGPPNSVAPADFDGDGDLDFAFSCLGVPKLIVMRMDTARQFTKVFESADIVLPRKILTGDYDGDGWVDVVVTGYGPQLQFFRNGGGFQFARVVVTTPGYIDLVVQGDYDGDGDLDFVCASSSPGGTYNFLRNDGNFNFTISSQSYSSFMQYPVNGDFDGDGDIDIALSTSASSIFRNNGACAFTHVPNVVLTNVREAADVDEDGDLDLLSSAGLLSNPSLASVQIHRNLGDLQFESPFPGVQPNKSMLSSDLNGDGREDIATVWTDLVQIHTNSNASVFSLKSSFAVGPLTTGFATWDYDGDGDADIVVWSSQIGRLSFFENRQDFSTIVLSDAEHNFSAVVPDSTSRWSLIVSNPGTIPLVIDSIATHDASFVIEPAFLTVPPGDSATVLISFTPTAFRAYIDKVFLYSNDADRPVVRITVMGKAYQRVAEVVTPAPHDPAGIGDTIVIRLLHPVDVASIAGATIRVQGSVTGTHQHFHRYDETRQLLTVVPAGRFSAGERVTVTLMNNFQFAGGVPVLSPFFTSFIARATEGTMTFSRMTMMYGGPEQDALCSADFDNNGTSDIAFTRSLTKTLNFVRVNGPYLYERLPEIFLPIAVTDLRPGDMDGDGVVDLVIYSPGSMDIYLNKGGFSFTRWWVGAIPESKGLAVADLDGDGALDFVTVNVTSGTVQIFYHVNDKWLRYTKVDYPIGAAEPQQIETGDIDNDGDIDIILGKMGGANIVLMINDGDQTFHAVPLPNATSHAQTIWTADFDADGWLDIALDRSDENSVLVLRNRHDLTFDVVAQPRVTYDPLFLVGGDYDADGDCDLIASNNGAIPTIAKYRNDSLHLTQIGDFPTGAGSFPMISGDFDGNGSVDVAFIDQKILALVILQNRKAVPFTLIHDSLDFGDVHVGTSRSRQVHVLNVSPSAITIDSIRTYVDQFRWNVDKASILPGDSALITVTFSPTENGWMGIMLAIFIQGEEPVYRNMTGTGVGGTGVERIGEDVPKVFALLQNYPNPFNPATQILFDVPEESRVRMEVFDLRGREVGSVVDLACSPGTYAYTFRADGLVSGVYFYRMSAVPVGNPLRSVFQSTKKMVMLK